MSAAQGTIASDNNQSVDSAFIHFANRFALTFRLFETFTATRLQNCSTALEDSAHITRTHGMEFAVQQPLKSIRNADYMCVVCLRCAHNRADSCIHSWCIPTGGKHSNRKGLCVHQKI